MIKQEKCEKLDMNKKKQMEKVSDLRDACKRLNCQWNIRNCFHSRFKQIIKNWFQIYWKITVLKWKIIF